MSSRPSCQNDRAECFTRQHGAQQVWLRLFHRQLLGKGAGVPTEASQTTAPELAERRKNPMRGVHIANKLGGSEELQQRAVNEPSCESRASRSAGHAVSDPGTPLT